MIAQLAYSMEVVEVWQHFLLVVVDRL